MVPLFNYFYQLLIFYFLFLHVSSTFEIPQLAMPLMEPTCETERCIQIQANRMRKQSEREAILYGLRHTYAKHSHEYITTLPFHHLVESLQNRSLTASQVMAAYIKKSVNVTSEFNCVSEFIPNAMDNAMELDRLQELKGPLHGVPFCVKDDHDIIGMDTTLGYSQNVYKPANRTATIVEVLMDLGAVPFCKTNVPQTLMSFGSDNPVFGATVNPLNKLLSPGGSSSGSGCLVGARGVPFATGTDAAGSGRIPAHFNGISSIMPTSRRLSSEGLALAIPGFIGVNTVPAIFAPNPHTVATIFKALTENERQHYYDGSTVPLSWNAQEYESKRPLRFGYITSLSFFPAMGDTPWTVLKTKEALEAMGHTVVPFEFPDAYEYMKLLGDFVFADGGKHFEEMVQDDRISHSFRMFYLGIKFPSWPRRLASSIPLSSRVQLILQSGLDTETSGGLQQATAQGRRIRGEILRQMRQKNLDLLLSPVFPIPAVRLDDPPNLFLAVAYVALWNIVDFPAGVLPMGRESGKRVNDVGAGVDVFLHLAKMNLRAAVGMPIGVQIIGKPYQEERILRIMRDLEAAKPTMLPRSEVEETSSTSSTDST